VIIAWGRGQGQGMHEAVAKQLKQDLVKYGMSADQIHVVSIDQVAKARGTVQKENRQVSTAIYVGHGKESGTYLRPGGKKDLTVKTFADQAGVDPQGAVIIVACNVGKKLDSKTLPGHKIRVYATERFVYWTTKGDAATSDVDTKKPGEMGAIAKGHRPGDIALPRKDLLSAKDPVGLESAGVLGGGPSPASIALRTLQADMRTAPSNPQPQRTQQKPQARGR
jgi:hypothetical protein